MKNNVIFIGHAGCYYGAMNSEEAFLYAIKNLKYHALETDLKQTKDGVFVLSHDDTFGKYELKNTNYKDLKDEVITVVRNKGYPKKNGSIKKGIYKTKIFTLKKYLKLCKKYNRIPVIELKYSKGINQNDQSRMKDLINLIKEEEMLNKVIFLTSQYNCLIWLRKNGYKDVTCQYLVKSIESKDILNLCKKYNFDISFNINESNSRSWIKKYQNENIKVSAYTFNQYIDYDLLRSFINKGVNYVTTDWHVIEKV